MCGIGAFWFKESIPWNTDQIINTLFVHAEKRGVDGTGFVLIRRNSFGKYYTEKQFRTELCYSSCKSSVLNMIHPLHIGDVLLVICRAAPETEPRTTVQNMQPIYSEDIVLVHNGAVSQKIVKECRSHDHYQFKTSIDSECIISVYTRLQRDIKLTQEYVSGGYAYVMVDLLKGQMYVVNDFKPLATGYIKGLGYMVASDNSCLSEIVKICTDCERTGMNVWEYYYNNPQKGPLIRAIDLDSGFEQHIKFRPRYITSNWDSSTKPSEEELCLVSASGGLDSSLTLAILKLSGYKNIIACHFDYGHRGSEAEKCAISKVCKELEIPLKVFPLSNLYKEIEVDSMLTNNNAEIITGTENGLKTTAAWVPGRNMMFVTTLATFAESEVMKHNYETVYILGGFLNLTESGTYPDNSEDFLRTFLEFCKYGTLCGDRFKPLYCLSNIMKSEQWLLVKHLGLERIIKHTISCDRPHFDFSTNTAFNCSKNGIPACGSGLLSWWGSKMVGMDDMEVRNFYEIHDEYEPFIPEHLKEGSKVDLSIEKVVDRILIPEKNKEILRLNILKK